MKKVIGILLMAVGVVLAIGANVGLLALAIFDIIDMVQANTATFGSVLGAVVLFILRDFIATMIAVAFFGAAYLVNK